MVTWGVGENGRFRRVVDGCKRRHGCFAAFWRRASAKRPDPSWTRWLL